MSQMRDLPLKASPVRVALLAASGLLWPQYTTKTTEASGVHRGGEGLGEPVMAAGMCRDYSHHHRPGSMEETGTRYSLQKPVQWLMCPNQASLS